MVKIQIIEGQLEGIQVSGNQRLRSSYIADRVRAGAGSPLNVPHLLENLQMLRLDPLIAHVSNVKELSELSRSREGQNRQAIELLVLSACNTTAGDERAALGLSGLAVKSGARSTVATLWPAKDQAAELLMAKFYDNLRNEYWMHPLQIPIF